MRIQKFLSRAGVASRRKSEELMRAGRVRVNGQVVTEMGSKVDPEADTVEVDGERVERTPPMWIALHKPAGYVSTRRDPRRRETVYDLLPDKFSSLFYVGRLDKPSEGLMLLTNQGDLAHRLLHPSFEVERTYHAEVEGTVTDAELDRLRAGIPLDDGIARAVEAERLEHQAWGGPDGRPGTAGEPSRDWVRLVLREGRKREVRRMLDAIGHPVTRLVRQRYGPIELGELAPGEWRELTAAEIEALRAATRD